MSKRAKLRKLQRELAKANKKKNKDLNKNTNKNIDIKKNSESDNIEVPELKSNNIDKTNTETIIETNTNKIEHEPLLYIKIVLLSLLQYVIFGIGVYAGYDLTLFNVVINLSSLYLYQINKINDDILTRLINICGILNLLYSMIIKNSYFDILFIVIYSISDVILCDRIDFVPNILSLIPNNIIGFFLRFIISNSVKENYQKVYKYFSQLI